MIKRLGKQLAALSAAVLLCAGSLAVFAPSASAHSATTVVDRYTCTHTYVPEFLSYETTCSFVPTTVNRWHIHTTERFCTWVTVVGATSGAVIGGALGGAPGAAVGGGAGTIAGYEVCRSLPKIIWLR